MKMLNLDNREQAEKEMRTYLKRECPHYLGATPNSIRAVADTSMELIEGQKSRVLVYDVKLTNEIEAFGTIGGILYGIQPPSCNVFPKSEIKKANLAVGMHLYIEAKMRFPKFFSKNGHLEQLAMLLEIPENLR